jgi:hypothetical protein
MDCARRGSAILKMRKSEFKVEEEVLDKLKSCFSGLAISYSSHCRTFGRQRYLENQDLATAAVDDSSFMVLHRNWMDSFGSDRWPPEMDSRRFSEPDALIGC